MELYYGGNYTSCICYGCIGTNNELFRCQKTILREYLRSCNAYRGRGGAAMYTKEGVELLCITEAVKTSMHVQWLPVASSLVASKGQGS